LIKISALILTFVITFSCDEDIPGSIGGQFIQLADASDSSISENSSDSVIIEVILGQPQSSDITVNFEVTGDASRYSVSPASSLVIPQGETSGTIEFSPTDNFESDGEATIVLALLASSDLPIGIGGTPNAVSKSITIDDDDCPITIEDWVGTYSVAEVFTSGANEGLTLSGAFGEVYQIELALAPNDPTGTQVVVANSAGFDTYITDGIVMTFLTCSSSVSFDTGVLTLRGGWGDHELENSPYNEGAFTITGNGPVGNFGPYEWVWTKQ